MTEFKCEQSGWYETRDGRIAEVVVNPGSRILSIVGYIGNLPTIYSWFLHGNYYLTKESDIDLIKYLGKERPKKKKTVKMAPALHRHGEGGWVTNTLYRSEQDAKDDSQRDCFIRWLIDTHAVQVEVEE